MRKVVFAVALAIAAVAAAQPARRAISLIVIGGTVITENAARAMLTPGAIAINGTGILDVDRPEAIATALADGYQVMQTLCRVNESMSVCLSTRLTAGRRHAGPLGAAVEGRDGLPPSGPNSVGGLPFWGVYCDMSDTACKRVLIGAPMCAFPHAGPIMSVSVPARLLTRRAPLPGPPSQ